MFRMAYWRIAPLAHYQPSIKKHKIKKLFPEPPVEGDKHGKLPFFIVLLT